MKHLEEDYIRELSYRRVEQTKETLEQATEFVMNYRKNNPEKFDFLYHAWYKDHFKTNFIY